MRRAPIPALLAALALAGCAHLRGPRADSLAARADAVLALPESEGALVSALVLDAATGEVLFARREGTRGIPASTMKVVTTAAALATLGAEFRFRTPVTLEGRVSGATFTGDLVVDASGDPSLGSWRWPETEAAATCERVAAAFSARGLERWRGGVRVRGGEHVDAPLGPGWAWDDLAYDYSAPATAFVFRENVVDLRVTRAASAACDAAPESRFDPPLAGLAAEVRAESSEAVGLSCVRDRGSSKARCTWRAAPGTCPRDASLRVTIDDAGAAFTSCLEAALARAGIERVTSASEVTPPPEVTPLLVLESPPLAELVRATNKESLNLYAERLAAEVARARLGTEGFTAVRDALKADLAERGIPPRALAPVDGSGLSRYNQASAAGLAHVMLTGLRAPYADALLASLPVAGVDGTLARRGGAARELVRAKTGSMTAQRAWVGVADRPGDARHPRVVFALLVGNVSEPSLSPNEVFDRFAEALVSASIR